MYLYVFTCVYWMLKTNPVIFGEDVELFCNYNKTSNHSCDKCTRRWHLYLASDFKLLSFNGFPSEISKYNTTDSLDGFGLVIKNFSEQDLTGSYRCSYGFENDRKKLDIGNNYECYPMNNTLDSRYSFNDHTILTMGVDFKEVHPYPNCTTSFNSKDVTSKVITKSELIQIFFYKVTFTLILNIKDYGFCKGDLHMTCLIGSKQLDPIKTTFDECFDNKNQWAIIASLITCVSIIAIMCIVICRNKHCRNKLKDALPCTKSTRETDSNEMTDFVDEKNKSGEKPYMRNQTKRTTEAMIVTDVQPLRRTNYQQKTNNNAWKNNYYQQKTNNNSWKNSYHQQKPNNNAWQNDYYHQRNNKYVNSSNYDWGHYE